MSTSQIQKELRRLYHDLPRDLYAQLNLLRVAYLGFDETSSLQMEEAFS